MASLSNIELLEKIGLLSWIQHNDPNFLEKVTTARIGMEMYQRMSSSSEIDALRTQTIMNIAKYIKDHPKAKQKEITKELGKQIYAFAKKVEEL